MDDAYRIILLTKAGVSPQKREVLAHLDEVSGISVVGVVVEDLVHGPPARYVGTLIGKAVRRRGRGYGVRAFNAFVDVFRTLASKITDDPEREPTPTADGERLKGVPIIEVSDMLAESAIQQISALEPDLAIVWGTRVLPPEIFELPTDGSIGIHHGKIPEYRGGPAGFWELYNGEDEAGVTVQKLAVELDAGKIISQDFVPIESRDSPADIRAKQDELVVDLVIDAVSGLYEDRLEPREWDGEKRPVNTPPTIPQLLKFHVERWRAP